MTDTGGSAKAKRLAKGDRVEVRGLVWTISKAKRDKPGKRVQLAMTGPAGTFTNWVPEGRTFELVGAEPLTSPGGAQTRWATDTEHVERTARMVADGPRYDDGETPELDPWVPSTDAEQAVASIMGGTLVGAQLEPDGRWFVPPVDASTVLAHLLTFHATTPPSASLEQVRTPTAEALDTAAEALMRADIMGALALHQQLHDAETWPDDATPHRHA